MTTPKPPPVFEFIFPTFSPPKPPFVQVVYENETLTPVQYDMAERYSRFMSENIKYLAAAMPSMFVVTLPPKPNVSVKSVQAVVEALVNGRIRTHMDERTSILRACRLLKVDMMQKAIEDHLNKGCQTRPDLRLQCLEAVFDAHENDEFRRQRFKDARMNFYSIVNSNRWVKMNVEIIRELIHDDVQLLVKERDLYLAVLKWLVSNPLQIPAHCDRLLGLIRFGSMSTNEKFSCFEEARCVGLDSFVKPYLVEGDWYRTCHELNHAEFTELVEFDRLSHFIGENRRGRALEAYAAKQRVTPEGAISVDTVPLAMDRVKEGKIQGGTWMPRPRPETRSLSEKTNASGRSKGITETPMRKGGFINPRKLCGLSKGAVRQTQ